MSALVYSEISDIRLGILVVVFKDDIIILRFAPENLFMAERNMLLVLMGNSRIFSSCFFDKFNKIKKEDMMKQKKSFLDKIVGPEEEFSEEAVQPATRKRSSIMIEDEDKTVEREQEMESSWGVGTEEGEEDGQLAIDVYQDDDFVVIKSIVGGIRPEDLDLSVTSDMVTIRGSRERAEEVAEENYYYQECFWGSFSRSVILPCDIKVDQVEASMKNGILTIKMPKVEKNSATKIQVRGE